MKREIGLHIEKRSRQSQRKVRKHQKTFVLDTNVLIHDPNSPWKFKDNIVIIPLSVLSELDNLKSKDGAIGASARACCRKLHAAIVNSDKATTIKTPDKGEIRFATLPEAAENHQLGSRYYTDNILLEYVKRNAGYILVTKDVAMTLKGRALGICVQDYINDKSDTRKQRSIHIDKNISDLSNPRTLLIESTGTQNEYATLDIADFEPIPLRYDTGAGYRIPQHYAAYLEGNSAGSSIILPGNIVVQPRNAEQWMLLDAVTNPTIKLVTAIGKAGTGKTYITLAGALYETLVKKHFKQIYITRPVMSLGRDLGALPGTMEEKMNPYLQPYYDNLGAIFKERAAYMKYISSGIITVEALTYIRGRSLENVIMLVDESQNLTPHEAKTIITRMGKGSKLILLGDPDQIDSPYLDKTSNGLVYTQTRLRGSALTAGVVLTKGERSELAELAANLL